MRTDILLADQIVQVGHACLEAGFKFQKTSEMIHLIVVCVESEIQLLSTLDRIGLRGIQFAAFHEPENQMGLTAACTQPLTGAYRREFRYLPLWKLSREVSKT